MNTKITIVDALGDVVAFKPKEIQVLASVYEAIPTEFQEDFGVILNTARDKYIATVEGIKAKGEKPKAVQIKKEVITSVIKPFLNRFNISEKQKRVVIKTDNPRIPKDSERVTLTRKQTTLVDCQIDESRLSEIFDKFDPSHPEETIPDMTNVLEQSSEVEVPEVGFGDLDLEGLLD